MRLFDSANPPRLRTPYLVFSILLSLVVSLFALSNYQAAAVAYRDTHQRLQQGDRRGAAAAILQRNLNALYRAIDLHLLDPYQHEHAQEFRDYIDRSLGEIDDYLVRFPDYPEEHQHLNSLQALFKQLGQQGGEIFAIRTDPPRQHPALAISAYRMTPNQNLITDSLGTLQFEIESGLFTPDSERLYPLLLKSSLEWSRLVSQVRIYLANRLGSFALNLIDDQERTTREIAQQLRRQLGELAALYDAEPESFEGANTIRSAQQTVEAWANTLEEVFLVNRSDRWREDSYRMEHHLIPLVEQMDRTLNLLLSSINAEKNAAIEAFGQNSRAQLTAQAVIIALFVVFLILLLSSLDLLVFRPLAKVAATLRSRAFHEGGLQFPRFRSRETQQLIDAFNEMDANIQAGQASLRASEQRFREIAENIRSVFWVGSADWSQIFYVSPYFETLFGIPCAALYADPRSWFGLLYPEDRETVQEVIQGRLAGIISTPNFPDCRIMLPDGEVKWVAARAYQVIDQTTGQPKIIGIMEDITKEKLNEEALRRTQRLNAMRQLTGGIAHDFNNILGVILGFAELTERRAGDAHKVTGYAGQIQRACDRARRLTNKLLMFSRREASSSAEAIDLNALLLEEQPILEKTLTARIRLHYGLTPDLWPVWADPAALGDAILNMTINALHAMPEGGELRISTVNVRLIAADQQQFGVTPGEYVLLAITDTGIGMDRQTLDRMFEPFFTTKAAGGTGLGMSQVYGLIQQSKGEIQVLSEPGRGTRILIYLPRHLSAEVTAPPPAAEACPAPQGGLERILVVDDEPALRAFFREVLAEQGYRVQCAKDAAEALALLEESPPDLLLSDVVMPGMDGYQLALRVHQRHPQVRIQLLSGFSDSHPSGAFAEALYRGRLHKPVRTEALLLRIRQRLDEPPAAEKPATAYEDLLCLQEGAQRLQTGLPEIDGEHQTPAPLPPQ
jgi:PAS domain S-box-containing protein